MRKAIGTILLGIGLAVTVYATAQGEPTPEERARAWTLTMGSGWGSKMNYCSTLASTGDNEKQCRDVCAYAEEHKDTMQPCSCKPGWEQCDWDHPRAPCQPGQSWDEANLRCQ